MANILIVEDEYFQAKDVEALVRSRGHTVCGVVNSGEEALSLAQFQRPDVVLVDVTLVGRLDGIETAKQLVAQHRCALIFITGYNPKEVLARIDALAPAAIVTKPLDRRALVAAVERAVGKF